MTENTNANSLELTPEDEIDLQKLRMKAKFGCTFGSSETLPPEIELQWLKNIEKFEDTCDNRKTVTVREILGDLKIKDPADIPKAELENALNDLLEKMSEKGISLDILADTPAIDIYNFIVNELLVYETEDMRGTGFTTHFCYEEFHPNDKYDINRLVEDFITGLCSMQLYDHLIYNLSDLVCDKNGIFVNREEIKERIRPFSEAYEDPEIKEWEIMKLDINHEKTEAEMDLYISYSIKSKDNGSNSIFSGLSNFILLKDDLRYWGISKFTIPGLSI